MSRRLVLLVAFGAAACSATPGSGPETVPGDPDGAKGCTDPGECNFGESCIDATCQLYLPDPVVEEGCAGDGDCEDGYVCALSTGICVLEAEVPEPTADPEPSCEASAVRPCGSKVGACEYGSQSCVIGEWSACDGGVGPAASENDCNSIDDDCDGFLSNSEKDIDSDGYRICDGDCNDGNSDIFPDNPERCDGLNNDCDASTDETSMPTLCNDENECTIDSCTASGTCSHLDDPVCDCSADPAICATQDDGNPCNGILVCDGTTCEPDPSTVVSCPAGDSCKSFACNPENGQCEQQNHDGVLCDDGLYCTLGERCLDGSCDGTPRDCSDPTLCTGTCDETADRCVPDPLCNCDDVDNDFDGQSECDGDCDDTNGGVFLGATERCNGLDDDCDGIADEDFDLDHDTWSVCATLPSERDCNDEDPTVNPGATEDCGPDGTGTGVDEDCDGYIDELCTPCSAADVDGDGFSECEGDCDDAADSVFPGASEQCDGNDNDCNTFTTENCAVSDPCNWPGDPAPDVCRDELLCVCVLDASGSCTGNYRCTSLCDTSQTGAPGEGCATDEVCGLNMLNSANVSGCTVDTALAVTNTKAGGAACAADSECRSNRCQRLFTGAGQKDYCWDVCASDTYCPGSICRIIPATDDLAGYCWPNRGRGTTATGGTCTLNTQCDHLFCATVGGARYCSEPCCRDADCPTGFTCSLMGDQIYNNYVYSPPAAPPCESTTDCPDGMVCYTTASVCAYRVSETAPMCVRDGAGQGARQAGAACTVNNECSSNFCEATLGLCVEPCCADTACPTGLTCELQLVEAGATYVTNARVCMNQSTEELLVRK